MLIKMLTRIAFFDHVAKNHHFLSLPQNNSWCWALSQHLMEVSAYYSEKVELRFSRVSQGRCSYILHQKQFHKSVLVILEIKLTIKVKKLENYGCHKNVVYRPLLR